MHTSQLITWKTGLYTRRGENWHVPILATSSIVKGVAITPFCDDNRLTSWQRLEQSVSVRRAVLYRRPRGLPVGGTSSRHDLTFPLLGRSAL